MSDSTERLAAARLMAELHYDQGAFGLAAHNLSEVIELSRDPLAYFQRALCWEKLGKHQDAAGDAIQALRLQLEDQYQTEARRIISSFCRAAAPEHFHRRDWAQATSLYSLIIEFEQSEPRVASALYWRAYCQEQLGNLDAAIQDVTRALQLSLKEEDRQGVQEIMLRAASVLALRRFAAGHWQEVVKYCTLVIERRPDAANHFLRAFSNDKLGCYEAAAVDADQALKLGLEEERHSQAHSIRGKYFRSRAVQLTLQGESSKAQPFWRQAAEAFENAVFTSGRPVHPSLLLVRGMCLRVLGQLEGALVDLDAVIAQEHNLAMAHYERAVIHHLMGNHEPSFDDATRALNLGIDGRSRFSAHSIRGGHFKGLGQWEHAVAEYSTAIAISIALGLTEPILLLARAECLLALERYSEAVPDLEETVKQQHDLKTSLARLTKAYAHLEEWVKALDTSARYLELKSTDDELNSLVRRARVTCCMRLKHFKEAVYEITQAIELEPRSPSLLLTRGKAKWLSGSTAEEAIVDVEESIRLEDPPSVHPYVLLGAIYAQEGKQENALKAWDTAIAVDPRHTDAYYARAKFHSAASSYKLALEDLGQIANIRQLNGHEHLLRAACQLALDDVGEALASVQWAMRCGIQKAAFEAEALRLLGECRLRKDETQRALDDFTSSIKKEPNQTKAYFLRAGILVKRSLWTAAKADLDFILDPDRTENKVEAWMVEAFQMRATCHTKLGRKWREQAQRDRNLAEEYARQLGIDSPNN